MFPMSIAGRIEIASIPADQVPALVAALRSALERARASEVSCTGNLVVFRAGLARMVSNLNVLVPVGSGVVKIQAGSPGGVAFRCSCVQLLVVISVMALFVAALIPGTQPPLVKFGVPLVMWLWLFGANFVIASFRLPAFFRRAVRDAEAA
jgi:hypothetical protein